MRRHLPLTGLCAGLCALLIAGPAVAAPAAMLNDHPLSATLWDTRSGRAVGEETLFAEAAQARWVLLGEKHDNAEHHRLQARVVDALGRAGRKVAVVWEMAEPEHTATLRDATPGEAAGLGEALAWESRGWPNWSEYQPIAEAALAHRLPMLPGKPSRQMVRRFSKGESLPADLADRLDWSRPYPAAVDADIQEGLRQSHCGALPETAIAPMARVQRLWDAWMANSMRKAVAPEGSAEAAVLIAGAGHVREDRAVPWFLPGDSVTVAMVEVVDGRDRAADYPSFDPALFDFVWFTPRVDDKDPCADFTGKSG